MAESLRSQFQEHLSCAICLKQLRDPKVLPCLHSYCHECIAKLDMTDNKLTCPECRNQIEVPNPPDVSFLPPNFFAKNLLATLLLTAEPDSRNIVCENCESGEPPETRCQQCTRYLCQFCTEYHKRSRDTKAHKLSTLNDLRESNATVIAETVRCPKHEGEIIKLYCRTCQETICRDCAIVDHRQHDFVFVQDVSQEKKNELLKLVGDVKQRRSEMSESLAYLKKMEEIVHENNESAVRKINQYFENLGSVVENKKNEFLEKARAVKRAKLKQLHLQQEELELNLGNCDSSIDFTEQAFKNGSDVQILNLTKYMRKSLENLIIQKETEIHQPSNSNQLVFTTELTEHVYLCDQMAQFHFIVDDNRNSIECTATFSPASQHLTVDKESEIVIKRKETSSAVQTCGQIPFSPSFEGVAVQDVTLVDNDDGSRTVKFRPTHVGELTFIPYMNGSRVSSCVVRKAVKKDHAKPKDCRIGDRVFESGVHTWKIKIDHSNCASEKRVNFRVGIICYTNNSIVDVNGYVKPNDREHVNLTLDMENDKLTIKPSWSKCSQQLVLKFKKVSPYFSSDCNKCELSVTADDWCLVSYQ